MVYTIFHLARRCSSGLFANPGRPVTTVLLAASVTCFMSVSSIADGGSNCKELDKLELPDTTITGAELTRPGFLPPPNAFSAFQDPAPVNVEFCRVTGVIAPAIEFEVWLPIPRMWNDRLQGTGNGGMAGVINYASLQGIVETGYAGVASDLGHKGGFTDGAWAINHPELIRDWGHRATHEMTVKAKAIIAAYYGRGPEYSYFTGCSGGGRQGMMEAQRYPEDYDGILAGDPTMDFSRLVAGGRLWQVVSNMDRETGQSLLARKEVQLVSAAVIEQCDALDGVSDGVLTDPRQCQLDTQSLLCKSSDDRQCLSAEQVTALEKIYQGATDSSGNPIYPGYMPGGELGRFGWVMNFAADRAFDNAQWVYAKGFLQGLVFEDLNYDPLTFNYDTDVSAMDNKEILGQTLAETINATQTNLEGFKKAGGKLIHYHGWNDPGVSPLRSVQYYENVNGEKDDYYRLFMVPGLQHCFGGPGANMFGAAFTARRADDASSNIFKALELWVEEGVAPDRIIATKYQDDDPAQGMKFTRPLCPYPEKAVYQGDGSVDDAANFRCE